eukprot:TRINITY_DN7228_c0_g2_i4.p1 TRINITY_DN7228_c0_g2~~TRINITY_DN7228_c0_g2_i4.p1  ORF type:complete len:315 (-),score=52.72 TRINITY_DN7228_c0_g2_i4:338-1282(-)
MQGEIDIASLTASRMTRSSSTVQLSDVLVSTRQAMDAFSISDTTNTSPTPVTSAISDEFMPLKRRESMKNQSYYVSNNGKDELSFVCISDTHGHHAKVKVPPADVFIHCGDFSVSGTNEEVASFNDWLQTLPHKYKIVVAGNHDITLHPEFYEQNWHRFHTEKQKCIPASKALSNCIYLQDSSIFIDGIHIYGSPWQPTYFNWAFNLDRGAPIKRMWDLIPNTTDLLITHGPPWGILDRNFQGIRGGCEDLLAAVKRVKPLHHLFGHIHEGYGEEEHFGVGFGNASTLDGKRRPWNRPITFTIKKKSAESNSPI